MAKRKSRGPKPHKFRNKLLLNQWLVSLFGINPLQEHKFRGKAVRPFHLLADPIKDPRMEGLGLPFTHKLVIRNLVAPEQRKRLTHQL